MRVRGWPVLACLLLLAACATSNRGWTGDKAMPFDAAQADCDSKTRELPAGKERETAFDACMKEHGWRRP